MKGYTKSAQNVLRWMPSRDYYLGGNSAKTNRFVNLYHRQYMRYEFGTFFKPVLGWWRHYMESKVQSYERKAL